jgi:hypothetical protein
MKAVMHCCSPETLKETSAQPGETLPADPTNAPMAEDDPRRGCVRCGGASHAVTRQTILLMLKPEQVDRVGDGPYRFCSASECRVVYFVEGEDTTFTTADLRVRVGLKAREAPIPLCYCFGFDEADLRDELARTGRSVIPQRIASLVKQGLCACPAKNPSGVCCLGEVTRAVRRLSSESSRNG